MRRRRRRKRAAELTPLIDVLFILLFASLIQARSAGVSTGEKRAPDDGDPAALDAGLAGADAAPIDAALRDAGADPGTDAGAPSSSHLAQSRQLAENMARAVKNRDTYLVEITHEGYVVTIAQWSEGRERRREALRYRLLRPVLPGESNREFEYLGMTNPDARICKLVRQRFPTAPDGLAEALVTVVVDVPLDDLPRALDRGIRGDLAGCFADGKALGILIEPGEEDHVDK